MLSQGRACAEWAAVRGEVGCSREKRKLSPGVEKREGVSRQRMLADGVGCWKVGAGRWC